MSFHLHRNNAVTERHIILNSVSIIIPVNFSSLEHILCCHPVSLVGKVQPAYSVKCLHSF